RAPARRLALGPPRRSRESQRTADRLLLAVTDAVPTYLGSDGESRFTDYYPAWFENLADDVTIEGSLLDGAVQRADAIRTIIGATRGLNEPRASNFAGPYGDNRFLEDYISRVRGEHLGAAIVITFNAEGQTQHIAANYRPRSSLLVLSRLMAEQLADTP